jgi:uncharacterized protein (TIGR03437 family)
MNRQLLLLCATCLLAFGQAGPDSVITTAAGTDWLFPGNGRQALDAPVGGILGLAADSQGNFFIADGDNHMVMRIGTDGILNVIGGNGVPANSGDNGPAITAGLDSVRATALGPAGDLYVISSRSRIRRISLGGIITTIAGNGQIGYDGDNKPAIDAAFNNPYDLAVDAAGAIYLADTFNHRIRKITPNGVVTTIAGTGVAGDGGENIPATSAALNTPTGVAVDSNGNVYIADSQNRRIRQVTPNGIISSVVIDVLAIDLAFDGAGTLHFSGGSTHAVYKIVGGRITTVAGIGEPGFSGDGGPATQARLNAPSGIAVDAASNVYIADSGNGRIRRVTPNGIIATVAGNGLFRFSGEGGPAITATLYLPQGSAADAAGNLYISEPYRNRVRRISPTGILTTYVGTGRAAYSGDGGQAQSAELSFPTALAFDRSANALYIVDQANNRIRRVGPDGIITTVAGNGQSGPGADEVPANHSSLNSPDSIALRNGNLYIADTGNHRIRLVDTSGRIRSIAGIGQSGKSEEGIPATRAALAAPRGVAIDTAGNVYLADTGNNRIRRIDASGMINTVAGTSVAGNTGDGAPALAATLSAPTGLAFDLDGNLFFADQSNNRIRCFIVAQNIVVAVAGNGQPGYSGDGGLAPNARLRGPTSLAVDPAGNAFIADSGNHRIRHLKATPPSFAIDPARLDFKGNARAAPQPAKRVRLLTGVPNVPFTATVQTNSGGNWLSATPLSGAMPTTIEVTADPQTLTSGTFTGLVRISAPLAIPPMIDLPVQFVVEPALPARILAQPDSLKFSFTQGSAVTPQSLTIINPGSGSKEFSASARTSSGGNWLSVSPASGIVSASTPGIVIEVRVNPSGLRVGTYLGQVVLSSLDADPQTVPVTLTVNAVPQHLVVSPVGLTFVGVQNGGAVPPQTFAILNGGSGTLTWRARVSEASGGTPWLSLGSESGSTGAAFVTSAVEVRTNLTGLGPGDYYGQIEITSPEAANSPQFVSVYFAVLAPGTDPGPVVEPSGLVFRSTGQGSPGSQEIRVSNLGSREFTFRSSRAVMGNRDWFLHIPADATVTPQQPSRIVVQPQTEGLPRGVYEASLTLLFTDNTSRELHLLLVHTPPGTVSTSGFRSAEGCTPTKLLPVPTSVGLQQAVLAGWPNPLVVEVLDDCGDALMDGSVVSEFSNNDPPVLLTSSKNGKWSGIWQIRSTSGTEVTVRVKAARPEVNIEGTTQVTAALRQSTDVPPVVQPGGVVSAASFAAQPVSPGGFVSIFGGRLADQLAVADSLPFGTELGNTSVTIAGRRMPLHFTSDGQVNAIVPYGINANTTHQLVVKRGSRIATPEPVTISAAQPGIFTKNAQGQGAILDVQFRLVDASNPVRAGDAIQIFCEGLGPVNPPVTAGSAAPSVPPLAATTEAVSVTISGMQASTLFAGLAPGFAGLYQVNAIVPAGVSTGDRVPVTVKVGDQESRPVTIAVR